MGWDVGRGLWTRPWLAGLLVVVGACSDPGGAGPVEEDIGAGFPDAFPTADPGGPAPVDAAPETKEPGPDVATADVPPGDVAGPACVEGLVCNDGDPCTVNDQCKGGVCVGAQLGCDDGVPCTADKCIGGTCHNDVVFGNCLIGGVCYSDQQPNPQNGCERCVAAAASGAWTTDAAACDDGDPCTTDGCVGGACQSTPVSCPDDGNPCTSHACVGGGCVAQPLNAVPCDDGDPCTVGDTCLQGVCYAGGDTPAEVCGDGKDNDCDGLTDGQDDDCSVVTPPGGSCAYHTDCYPEGVCAKWKSTGQTVCSVPCAGDSDCAAGHMCSKVPGSAQVGFCEAVPTGLSPAGVACTSGTQCASGLCTGVCVSVCMDAAHCPGATLACQPAGDKASDTLVTVCSAVVGGSQPTGLACTADGVQFHSGHCTTKHCDLLPWPANAWYCANLCKSDLDCPTHMECNIFMYAAWPNAASVPYDPLFSAKTHDTVTGCYTSANAGGAKQIGTPCAHPSECASQMCLPLLPGDPTQYCTSYCAYDAECGSGMACKLEATTLVSPWLNESFGTPDDQAPVPSAWTLARLCKFE